MPYSPGNLLTLKVETQINGVWTTITSRTRSAGGISIRHALSDRAIQPESSRCSLTIGNDDAWLTEGNPDSPWFPYFGRGAPIRVSLVGILPADAARFAGEIEEMEAVYPGGASSSMEITAIGTWAKLAQDDDPLRSAPYRATTGASLQPLIYWPLSLGREHNVSPPVVPSGGPAMQGVVDPVLATLLPDWTSGDVAWWLPGGVDLKGGGLAQGNIPAMPSGWVNTDGWAADVTCNVGRNRPAGESATPLLYLTGAGPSPTVDWGIFIEPAGGIDPPVSVDTVSLIMFEVNADGSSSATVLTDQSQALFDDQPHQVRLAVSQSGADIVWALRANGVQLAAGTVSSKTLQRPAMAELNSFRNDTYNKFAVVDLAVWPTASAPQVASAALGHAGETAIERIERLCAEEGVTVTTYGDDSVLLGPQRIAAFADLLTDAQEADMGILCDDPANLALIYRARTDLYDQAVRANLAQGGLTPDTKPTWDYAELRNDWTVSRPQGDSAHADDESHISLFRRRFKASKEVHVASDGDLPHQAQWRVHVGTASGPRYPSLAINMRSPGGALIADSVLQMIPGDRLTVAEAALPSQHPPGGLDQLAIGWRENIDADLWEFAPVCTPAEPYNVIGRWGLMAQELKTAVNATATSLDIATTSGPLLATSGIGSGYSVTTGGEEIRITAVAASTITYGAVGTASHANNASVTPGLPASLAQGNLMVMIAAIRNSGTGVPSTPAGWTRLPVFGSTANVQAFAKIAGSSESAPTVSFTGGVANADTTAQIIRLAGKWNSASSVLVGGASYLNASAQDINIPALAKPIADNAIVLAVGWKQDDFTSVATLSGMTEIAEASTTTGDDQSLVWDYVVQTTAAEIAATSFTVTGGASGISRGAIFALRCDYQTATVVRSVNGVAKSQIAGEAITLTTPARWGL